MYRYVCVYVCIGMYVCMCIGERMCIGMYVCMCIGERMYVCVYVHITYVYRYVCVYVHR